jgi:hypothetical protein
MSLDKRLKELLDEEINIPIREGEGVDPKSYFGIDTDELAETIKQAFIDEGWNTPANSGGIINFGTEDNPVLIHKDSLPFSDSGGGYIDIPKDLRMTGPEWLARFEKELPKLPNGEIIDDRGLLETNLVIKAARRASGVDGGS